MANTAFKNVFTVGAKPNNEQACDILTEMRYVAQKISETESLYNLTGDPDMTEFYILELHALGVRYNGLIKKAKQIGLCVTA